MRVFHIINLIIRVSVLPVAINVLIAIGMFLCHGFFSRILSLLFVVSSSGTVFIWVIMNIKAVVRGFVHGEPPTPLTNGHWKIIPSLIHSAADELAFTVRSHILSILLLGYVLIAFVFALAYHAIEGSQASTLGQSFYFSLTTLATVGYGDFSPQGFGRFLACIEMVFGVAYNVLAIGGGTAFLLDIGKHSSND